jgi:cellulose 1,4-beta-cellobiosidase
MTPLNRALALPAALLLAGGILAVSLPASSKAATTTTTLCNSQSAPVAGGAYTIGNNEWGSDAPECITTDGRADFTVANSSIAKSKIAGAPGGYPAIYKGCHWGACTLGSRLPVQVSDIHAGTVTTSWSTSQPGGSNVYNVAYDIWFNQTPSTSGAPNGAELMIWLNHHGPKRPYGHQIASNLSIGGRSYNAWFGPPRATHGWNTVSYTMTTRTASVSKLDLHALVADAVRRGYISRSWYLIDVEAGFELWRGGTGLATNSFSVNVAAGTRSRRLACHAVMSHTHPADHSTTDVVVRTADHAAVTTIAHFKTGNRSRKLRATVHGRAVIRYRVRDALAGYRVRVSVTVRRGSRSGTCSTWFTPRPA